MVRADNENERLVLEFFTQLSTGDLERLRPLLHEQVSWIPQVKDIPGAGEYHGHKGVIDDFLAPVRGMFAPGDPKTTVHTIVSKGPLVMVRVRWGSGSSRTVARMRTATRGLSRFATGRCSPSASTWIATTSPSCSASE